MAFDAQVAADRANDATKKFYDWALTPEARRIGAETGNFQTPSNKAVPARPRAPKHILEKWDREMAAMPH